MNIVVCAYCRVSTDKSDQINSLQNQIKYFNQYISKNESWTLSEVYFDEGISGTSTKKRTGFNRMINDALNGKFSLIITKEVSRFARNTLDTLAYTRRLKERGVGVYFVSDNINTLEADAELRLTIMASLAQEESRKTSQRVKWGQTRRMEQGVVFGRDLLGYKVKNGALIVNESEAEIVRLIFSKYVNEGKGAHTIAKELLKNGLRPKHALEWSAPMILKVLKNEKYVGDLCQKKTYTPDFLSHKKMRNRGQEGKVYLTNHHTPIVERAVFNKAQSELACRSAANKQGGRHSSRYWCSGKIVCGECGKSFVLSSRVQKNGKTYKAWRCAQAAKHGAKKLNEFGHIIGCDNACINNEALLNCAKFAVKCVLKNKNDLINEIVSDVESLHLPNNSAIGFRAESRLAKLRQKKKKAIDAYLEDLITKKELECILAQSEQEISCLLSERNAYVGEEKMQKILQSVGKVLDFSEQNELFLGEVIGKIIVNKNKTISVFFNHLPSPINLSHKKSCGTIVVSEAFFS